jgi:hypothetical protein
MMSAAWVVLAAASAAASPHKMTTPSSWQLTHMSWELEMFVHFSITTYTGAFGVSTAHTARKLTAA